MMPKGDKEKLESARALMDDFASRTGLLHGDGDKEQRYLWTDAFAVQTFFGLAHALGDDSFKELALKLIDLVHETLGRFHSSDSRQGWISGLSEEEGRKHPTAGGLRIGKPLPERKAAEAFNERLEWERDGQYFHYITRWINALLQAQQETHDERYAAWAAELLLASGKFIDKSGGRIRMYWKMSVDLSRPLVPSMGAHDPLEGLVCAESIREAAPEKAAALAPLTKDFEKLCAGQDWSTTDALGIGGLLLNTLRSVALASSKLELPQSICPQKLLADSLRGLKLYAGMHNPDRSANQRLAFRECGLSLGLRAISAAKQEAAALGLKEVDELNRYTTLADEIEEFWRSPDKQKAATWTEHLDINAVSLAASLVAHDYPSAFGAITSPKKSSKME